MHAVGQAPTASQIDAAVEEERLAAYREALAVHDRLRTAASRDLLDYARRSWQAAFADEQPSLRLIDGGAR